MLRSQRTLYLGTVAALLLLTAAIAITFGYITPDSWYYILLAQSLRDGHGCSVGGEYAASYPCGYPAALAATAPITSLPGLMISSKLTNILLLGLSFILTQKSTRHRLAALFLVFNPVTLLLGLHTWSENLLLLATCGVFYAIARLHQAPRNLKLHALLALFLIVGCFARYVFGPFALVLFIGTALAYGWKTALRVLPAFVLAAAVYLAYQHFNTVMTGYATGMGREGAPESPYLISALFIQALFTTALWPVLAAAALWLAVRKDVHVGKTAPEPETRRAAMLLIWAGAGFLALAFILRAGTQFDPFGPRTIGYGVVFIAAGLIGRFVHARQPGTYPLAGLLVCGLFSLVFANDFLVPYGFYKMAQGVYRFPAASVPLLKRQGPPADVIVYFELPDLPKGLDKIDTIETLHYTDSMLVSPAGRPDDTPDTPKTFLAKIAQARSDSGGTTCYFDFTPFNNADDFQVYLNRATQTDTTFALWPGQSKETWRADFDPALTTWLKAVFQPARMVPCDEILQAPATRRITGSK
jgi:hypothetical protein